MRTCDSTFLNRIANDPLVRPHLGGGGAIDMGPLLSNPDNIGFAGKAGGFVVEKIGNSGLYEGHSMFLPDSGNAPAETLRALLQYLFIETDCAELLTKIPEYNRGAIGLGRAAGFRTLFERENAWEIPGTDKRCKVSFASLSFAHWVATAPDLEIFGKWFHTRLEELTEGKIPEHTEEPIHNRMVGAAVLMFRAKNSVKGAAFYNRWAKFAGYTQIRLISDHPTIIDMDSVVVQVIGDDMEVLRCP